MAPEIGASPRSVERHTPPGNPPTEHTAKARQDDAPSTAGQSASARHQGRGGWKARETGACARERQVRQIGMQSTARKPQPHIDAYHVLIGADEEPWKFLTRGMKS